MEIAKGYMANKRFVASENSARGLMMFYNIALSEMGISLPPHLEPVCYALADQRIKKLMIIEGPGLGKSMMISVVYPAFRLGINRTENILGVSAGENLIQGFFQAIARIIETPAYQAIFPETRPDKGAGWSSGNGFFVTGHPAGVADASFFGCGVESSALTGKHCTTLILDDIHNAANSNTSEACDKVVQRYYDTILGRADPRGCRFIVAGRRWHQNDIYGELMKGGEYVVLTLPAERTGTDKLWYDVEIPDGLTCCFNE